MSKLSQSQVESILVLINREIQANEKAGDTAYNTHWEDIKKILLEQNL